MAQGHHFLQIPGPSPVPERIQRAIDHQVVDHRGPKFQKVGEDVLEGIKDVFGTKQPVIIFPASGTGAWEAAVANTLNKGDKVLTCETGQFAVLWRLVCQRWGIEVETIDTDWRRGADAAAIGARLSEDKSHSIKAVMVVHNETSTGCVTDIAAVRKAMDAAKHPALLLVDTVSSLGSMPVLHDEWGIDVTVSGSQKGLMMPPGLAFTAASPKAIAASKTNDLPRSYWDWAEMLTFNAKGFFPYTPAITLLYGLDEAIKMMNEEGLQNVFARHIRLGEAARAAVQSWGLETQCADPKAHSPVLTGVRLPEGIDADAFRKEALERFNVSFGTGLNKIAGRMFRIGHLGECNELTLLAALCAVEMTLGITGVPHRAGGVAAAMASLAKASGPARSA